MKLKLSIKKNILYNIMWCLVIVYGINTAKGVEIAVYLIIIIKKYIIFFLILWHVFRIVII